MKKALSTSIYLFYFTILVFGLTSCEKENAAVKEFAVQLNSKCPLQLDPLVRLNTVDFESPKTVIYNYTINLKDDSDADLLNALKENIKINTSYDVINKKEFKALKDAGGILKFVYKTSDDKPFLEYSLEPSFYEKGKLEFTKAEFEKLLEQSAIVMDAQLPQQANQEISFESVTYIAPDTLNYSYRFVDLDKENFNESMIENMKKRISSSFTNAKHADKLLKDNNTIFRFSYFDKNGEFIFSLDMTPEEYK